MAEEPRVRDSERYAEALHRLLAWLRQYDGGDGEPEVVEVSRHLINITHERDGLSRDIEVEEVKDIADDLMRVLDALGAPVATSLASASLKRITRWLGQNDWERYIEAICWRQEAWRVEIERDGGPRACVEHVDIYEAVDRAATLAMGVE